MERPVTPAGMRVTSALQVAPSAVEFAAFEPGACYVAALAVRNTGSRPLRFRLEPPPRASPFHVRSRGGRDLATTANPSVQLPPGLSAAFEVSFDAGAREDAIFHDALVLTAEDRSRLEVPLLARRASPAFDVEPSLCDLGLVVLAQRAAQVVHVRNAGARPGRFRVEVLDANADNAVVVTPLRGSLAPNEAVNVKVEVAGAVLGVFRAVVRLRMRERAKGGAEDEDLDDDASSTAYQTEKLVDVCGRVVEHNVELVLASGLAPVRSLHFGSLFAGESRTIETILRNNGPLPLLFKTTLTFGGNGGMGNGAGASSGGGTGEEDREAYERRKELQAYPAEGRVEPFAQYLVTFTYHPRAVDLPRLKVLEAKHRSSLEESSHAEGGDDSAALPLPPTALNAFASIQCVDLQAQNLTFEVSGKAFLPKVELSPSAELDFGDVKSHDRVDMLLSLKNLSGLPVRYSIPKIAHFAVKPDSGRLDVLQSQSLIASFAPTQLGAFQSTMTLSINRDVLAVPVRVRGRAAALGDVTSKPIVGGVQALPIDFVPQYKFLLPDEAKTTKGKLTKRFTRVTPYEVAALNGTAAVDEYEFAGTNNSHLTYCVKELAKRADHNAGYHEYLAACRAQREERQQRRSVTAMKREVTSTRGRSNNDNEDDGLGWNGNGDVNLGMERQSGVRPSMVRMPPELKLHADPLWLSQTSGSGGGSKAKPFFDENKFVKKKFKAQPATQAEIADCALNLDYDQLEQVLAGPKTLHFGKLSVNSVAKKSLSIQNNLSQNVVVALHLREEDHLEELAARTALKSQVVPPHSLAGFDLAFSSASEQFFQKQLGFSINGVHKREITVVAEVAPILVELSVHELQFEFSYLSTSPSMTREIALTNTSDSDAPFQWTLAKQSARPDSSKSTSTVSTTQDKPSAASAVSAASPKAMFEVLPPSGSLSPGGSFVCQVVYTPPPAGSSSQHFHSISADRSGRGTWVGQSFLLGITGGKQCALSCKALVQDSRVTTKEKKVDFGTVSVGIERDKKVTLSNAASDAAASSGSGSSSSWVAFYASVEPAAMAASLGLSVSPTVGTIQAEDSAEVVVKMYPVKPVVLDTNIVLHVQVRGGKSLKIPIVATVLVPEVFVSPPSEIAFGDVVLGVSVPRVVALENRSCIPASLVLDLGGALSEEFAVVMPPKLLARLEDASSVFIPLMDAKEKSHPPLTTDSVEADADAVCPRWQICIPPNATVSFHFTFTPKHPGVYSQSLPVQIAGMSSANPIARPESLTRKITATAIAPRLLFSSAVLDFHRCVITREGIRKVPYTKFLVLTNDDSKSIRWQIDTAQLKQLQLANPVASKRAGHTMSASASSMIFHLAPERGELAPGEDVKIRVSFLPLEAVEYVEDEIPLLLDDQFYIHVSVKGEGIHPHLSFSENKLVLPTVPLGVVARANAFIQSTGYDHLDLTYRVPLDLAKAPVSLHFPRGKVLSMACPKIPVQVRFCSKKSVAFNARIEFFDADGNVFHLPIAGCAENCLLTNHSFLQATGVETRISEFGEALDPRGGHDGAATASQVLETPGGFQFYSHPSMRFPIYLLPAKQYDAEVRKQADQGASHLQASGVIEIDSAATVSDDVETHSSSKSLVRHGSATNVGGAAAPDFSDREVAFLLQYLNANFLRNPVTKFPADFADAWGKPLFELLEMVCAKKPSGGGVMPALKSSKAGGGGAANQPSKKELLAHYTLQYAELLKFLKSYGAMLHDVSPEHLLSQEFYVRACEDPRADPTIFSTPALLAMRFLQRRHALEREWLCISSNAWMKVLYQTIKCFLLYRITAKGYALQQHTLRQQQSKAEVAPRACQGSNVYSEAEMVLLQWVCDNVRAQHATKDVKDAGIEARLLDVRRDLLDGRFLFHLVASHIPTLSSDQSEFQCFKLEQPGRKRGVSESHLQGNAQLLLQTLSAFGVDFGIDPDAFLLHMNAREMVVLLLHLHQTLPQFIPKATIEFRGVLGQPIEKSIELKNPSTRALRYQVFLDGGDATNNAGSSTFSIESNSVVLEPGKTEAFVVTFRARFSRKVTARLVFQSVREHSAQSASSGATMVFILESNIVSRKPVRVIQIETNTYEKRMEELVIENQFPAQAAYKVSMTQQQLPPHQSSTNAFSAHPGGPAAHTRRKSMQLRDRDQLGGAAAVTTNSFTSTAEVALPAHASAKKNAQAGKGRDESDFTWCMCAQQPFFLPEFGSSGSAVSSSDLSLQAQPVAGVGVVNIRSQSAVTVKLEFLPLLPGTYKCQLLFLDEKIGEFMYEVHAVAHLPASLDTLKFQCETTAGAAGGGGGRHSFLRELVVPVKNPLLSRALGSFIERASGHLKAKLKEGLKRCEDAHHTSFAAEFNSPFFASVHQELLLSSSQSATKFSRANSSTVSASGDSEPATSRTDRSGTDPTGAASSSSTKAVAKANQARLLTPRSNNSSVTTPNSVLVDFQPKGAGVYSCRLVLRSSRTVCGSSDLRVYDLEVKVKEPNVKTLLEFAAPARHSIVQEIPLSNPSDTPWTLKASFSNSSSSSTSMFSGPPVLQVPAKKSASYPLTFSPRWITSEKSSFVLVNPSTQQQFEFELSGYGEEPLAQDHVVIACQARTSVAREFDVVSFRTDPPGVQTYKVESDLRDVKGTSSITVPSAGGAGVKYPLTFSPIVSGTYFGSITFTNEATKEYIWYTIEANVSPPEPESTLDMRAVVRGAIGVEISLANPLAHPVTFAIELQGDGLLGPSALTLQGHEAGVYELVYSPMRVTREGSDPDDGAVLFSNEEIGQFWYRLQLTATRAPAQEMADMCCAVGDVCSQPILLQNPSDKDVLLQYRISNTRNFSIKGATELSAPTGRAASPPRVILPPFGQASVVVEYTPSSLSEHEAATIAFFEPDVVSDWEFVVKGVGKAPSVMKPITVAAKVHEAASTLFTFKNPFADTLRVDVKLVVDESESYTRRRRGAGGSGGDSGQVFDILLKKSRVQMESFGHLQVPISFIPQFVCEARAEIVIRGSEEYGELEWRYPIHGVAEAPLYPRPVTFACQARDSVEKTISCELLASPPDMNPSDEVFTVEWDVQPERFGALATAAAIERSLTVSALSSEGGTSGQNQSVFLPYHVRFEPLRPYRGSVYMLVRKKSGGLWRFEVALDTGDPQVDDTVTIESNLNQTSSVTFQLRNQFRQTARFLAEFSAGSSSAFTVYPAEGYLPPYGSDDGMPFVVSFTPTGYGKMQSGQLVILTEEMQWTFNIRGAYPDASSKSSGPSSSLSSSASRYRLGIDANPGLGSSVSQSPQSRSPGNSKAQAGRSRAK